MKILRSIFPTLVLALIFPSVLISSASDKSSPSVPLTYPTNGQTSQRQPYEVQVPSLPQAQPLIALQSGWAGTQITSGNGHTCALTSSGGVVCWGSNYYGVLGDGTTRRRLVPTAVVGLSSGVTAITAGIYHTCALTSGGGVKCWGSGGSGQLGNGTSLDSHTPVDVSSLSSGVAAIAAGGSHTCALTTTGGVLCWGQNLYGQLGNGTTSSTAVPTQVTGLESGVIAISAGFYHSCAVTNAGGVKCWGSNGYGQVGDGTTNTKRLTPTDVSNLSSGASAVSAGGYHTCAVLTNGDLKCWGWNPSGQLGDGSLVNRPEPVSVPALAGQVRSVEAGRSHTCAVTLAGRAKCWGYNGYGQVGDNTQTNRNSPVSVSGLTTGISAITAGDWHSCALKTSGEALCWGNNYYGQLGDGTTTQRLTPVSVASPGTIGSYTISGRVTDNTQAPVAGVRISANGDPGLETTTNASGYYTFTNMLPGAYILIPNLEGLQFEPLSHTVRVSPAASGVDFTAIPVTDKKKPIVFVPGFGGFPPDPPWKCTSEKQNLRTNDPDGDKYFSIVDDLFKASGFLVYYAHLVSNHCYTQSIEYNAGLLAQDIQQVISQTHATKVTLIAHSMGGLVSRAYLERGNHPDNVDHLFTFGTPHQGIPLDVMSLFIGGVGNLAAYCTIYGPAACEFSTSGMLLANQIYPDRNTTVNYHLISGAYSGFRNSLGNITNLLMLLLPNDGIVPTLSGVSLSNVDDKLLTNEQHNVFGPMDPTSPPGSQRYYNNYFYLREDFLLSDSYFICLKKVLLDVPSSSCTGTLAQQSLHADSLDQEQHTSLGSYTLFDGQTLTRTVGLEGGPTVFASTWQTGTINLTLVDPKGTVIDPIVAAANPGIITYTVDTNSATYSLDQADAGDWEIILHGSSLPDTGSNAITFAAFTSPLNLQYGLDREWYTPGQMAVITATLQGAPISSASISATISFSDGISQTVPLIASGGGIYSTTFTIPNEPGYTEIQIMGRGQRTDGSPFERGATQLFQISPPSIALNNEFREQPQPIQPGAAHYRSLDIDVGVQVLISGTYTVIGDLVDANGVKVAHAAATRELSQGSQAFNLRFEAAELYSARLDGPFTLTHLILIDERGGLLVVAQADDAYKTNHYYYWQFGNGNLYLPLLSG